MNDAMSDACIRIEEGAPGNWNTGGFLDYPSREEFVGRGSENPLVVV